MARLPTGQKPEPLKVRIDRYRENLIREGGRRLVVDIGPEANTALQAVMERDGSTVKSAVSLALIEYAGKR